MYIENPYEKVKEFHDMFHPSENQTPTAYSPQQALHRAGFKVEELVEFLYAASDKDSATFYDLTRQLKDSVDQAVTKIEKKAKPVENSLVEQVDALTDILYFVYGSFVLMGVEPTSIFQIVHEANMGKAFPDGKPRFDPVTNKILKPDDWEEKYAPEEKIKLELEQQLKKIE